MACHLKPQSLSPARTITTRLPAQNDHREDHHLTHHHHENGNPYPDRVYEGWWQVEVNEFITELLPDPFGVPHLSATML